MADLKDFNKPDLNTDLKNDYLDTLRGNIAQASRAEAGDVKNFPEGGKTIEADPANLIIKQQENNTEKEVFNFSENLASKIAEMSTSQDRSKIYVAIDHKDTGQTLPVNQWTEIETPEITPITKSVYISISNSNFNKFPFKIVSILPSVPIIKLKIPKVTPNKKLKLDSQALSQIKSIYTNYLNKYIDQGSMYLEAESLIVTRINPETGRHENFLLNPSLYSSNRYDNFYERDFQLSPPDKLRIQSMPTNISVQNSENSIFNPKIFTKYGDEGLEGNFAGFETVFHLKEDTTDEMALLTDRYKSDLTLLVHDKEEDDNYYYIILGGQKGKIIQFQAFSLGFTIFYNREISPEDNFFMKEGRDLWSEGADEKLGLSIKGIDENGEITNEVITGFFEVVKHSYIPPKTYVIPLIT